MTLSAKKEAVLNLIEKEPVYLNYLFRKIVGRGDSTCLEWFSPLKEKGLFHPRNNPQPVESKKEGEKGMFALPRWPALDYLECVSKHCLAVNDREIISALLGVIKDVTMHSEGNDNYITWWMFSKIITNLPTASIKFEDIALLEIWLSSRFDTSIVAHEIANGILKNFLTSENKEDWGKAELIIKLLTEPKQIDNSGKGNISDNLLVINNYSLQELFQKNYSLIGQKIGKSVCDILRNRLKILIEQKESRLSFFSRSSIEESNQNPKWHDSSNVIVSSLRDVLLAYARSNPKEATSYIKEYLEDNCLIIQRIAIYVIGQEFQNLSDILWAFLKPSNFNTNTKHELFMLLKENFKLFPPGKQSLVIEIISNLARDWGKDINKEKADASMRIRWLAAVKGQGNSSADDLFDRYRSILGEEPQHPEYEMYMEVMFEGDKSPYSPEDIKKQSDLNKLVKMLNDFRPVHPFIGEASEEGLGESLRTAIKDEPEKFTEGIKAFTDARPVYQYNLLRAFEEIWRAKKPINCRIILEFCKNLIESGKFWSEKEDEERRRMLPTREWIIGVIFDLIEEGTRTDEWAFEESLLDIVEQILRYLVPKVESATDGNEIDLVTHVINQLKGKGIRTLINYSLRCARIISKKGENRIVFWNRISDIYDTEINKCKNANFEFTVVMAQHLPNLIYLNEEWVKKNINLLFPHDYSDNWRCAIVGYAYIHNFYPGIYGLLKENGHMRKALESDFKEHYVRKQIIRSISNAYLIGMETLDEDTSLFTLILGKWDNESISEIIDFFWSLRDVELKKDVKSRILDFWRYCSARIKGNEESYASILSYLSMLTLFLDGISNESNDWLIQLAPYVEETFRSGFFIEYLNKLADKSLKEVLLVYLRMLEKSIPTFREEDIRSIIEKGFRRNFTDLSKKICDEYVRKGYERLVRDIYDKYVH